MLVLVTWPLPHPICVAAGTYQYFCSGLGHSLINIASLMDLAMLWSSLSTMLKLSRHFMTSDVLMVMDAWWSLHVLSESLCKSPATFPNAFFFTVYPATPEPVDHSTLLQDGHWLYCLLWKNFKPMFSADVLAALPHALDVWDNYVWLVTASFVGCIEYPLINVCLPILFDVGSR